MAIGFFARLDDDASATRKDVSQLVPTDSTHLGYTYSIVKTGSNSEVWYRTIKKSDQTLTAKVSVSATESATAHCESPEFIRLSDGILICAYQVKTSSVSFGWAARESADSGATWANLKSAITTKEKLVSLTTDGTNVALITATYYPDSTTPSVFAYKRTAAGTWSKQTIYTGSVVGTVPTQLEFGSMPGYSAIVTSDFCMVVGSLRDDTGNSKLLGYRTDDFTAATPTWSSVVVREFPFPTNYPNHVPQMHLVKGHLRVFSFYEDIWNGINNVVFSYSKNWGKSWAEADSYNVFYHGYDFQGYPIQEMPPDFCGFAIDAQGRGWICQPFDRTDESQSVLNGMYVYVSGGLDPAQWILHESSPTAIVNGGAVAINMLGGCSVYFDNTDLYFAKQTANGASSNQREIWLLKDAGIGAAAPFIPTGEGGTENPRKVPVGDEGSIL